MLNLTSNSTPKQIKNHRNIIYFCLTGALGSLRYISGLQTSYIHFLETMQRNNQLKIELSDAELNQLKRSQKALTHIIDALTTLIQSYKENILTRAEVKQVRNRSE